MITSDRPLIANLEQSAACASARGSSAMPGLIHDDQAALRCAAASDAALCTIVGIDGSFSRRLGAQLAIAGDGTAVGSLADGCLEAELARQAERARACGKPLLLRYGKGSPFIDFRLPCGSGLDIVVDPRPARAALGATVAALDRREEAWLDLPVMDSGLATSRRYVPALRLLILGDSAEAQALASLSAQCGIAQVQHGRGDGLALGRRPENLLADQWSAIVLLFHDHEWELPVLDWALSTAAFYIGAIGGKAARDARFTQLAAKGHSPAQLQRLRSPIGLIPAAREAGTLALGVLAEIVREYEAARRE